MNLNYTPETVVSSARNHGLERDISSAIPAVEVRILRTVAEVEAIRDIWSAWPSHRDSDVDFCLDFFWTRPEVIRPHVIVIYRDGRPDAMLVGRLERSRMTPKIGYLRLPGIPSLSLTFSYGGLLGDPSLQNCSEIIKSVMTALRQGEADMAVLDHLRVGSLLYEGALRASGPASRDRFIKAEPHSVMALPKDIEELYRGFSQGLRAEIRRKKKKVLADFGGKVEIRCYRELEEVESVIPVLEGIAQNTYQRGLGVGFQNTPQMCHRLRFCAQKKWLRIYILSVDGKASAFWVGTLSNQVFVSDYNAYDPSLRDYSLGTFLLAAVVEDFCKEGVQAIDFGFGQAEYKDRFANTRHIEASVHIFAPRPKGFALNAIRTSTRAVDSFARRMLEKTKLLAKIKRFWRFQLVKHG